MTITHNPTKHTMNTTDNFSANASSFKIINNIYNAMYPGEPTEAEGWLFNNLLSYMNDYQPSLSGFTQTFMEFINRGELEPITDPDSYLRQLDTLSCDQANRILWQKMLPHEQTQFISRWTLN